MKYILVALLLSSCSLRPHAQAALDQYCKIKYTAEKLELCLTARKTLSTSLDKIDGQ